MSVNTEDKISEAMLGKVTLPAKHLQIWQKPRLVVTLFPLRDVRRD